MASIDIFNDNAFGLVELSAALKDMEYQPNWLGSQGIFTQKSVRTEDVWIERKGETLQLVPTTPRGAALPQLTKGPRTGKAFKGLRVAKGDRLNASEIAGIRAYGSESEFEQVQSETADRMQRIRNDIDLTHENMRLGAVQGIVLDSDGTTELFNWFTEWGIAQPAEMTFNFADLVDGKLRKKTTEIARAMKRAAKGAWNANTRIIALCGDEFYDALISNAEVRTTYLNTQQAAELRGTIGGEWETFDFGRITWVNYQGTDDNSSVAIGSTKVKFFPANAPDAFLRVNSPGEFFDTINQPGQEYYAMTIPDKDRQAWVDIEVYSYPLYVATRPGMLLRGKLA